MRLWVEAAGREQKSAEQKTVTLIYPYPKRSSLFVRSVSDKEKSLK
jgi:hypothetical protein